jgi:hypothetical protein
LERRGAAEPAKPRQAAHESAQLHGIARKVLSVSQILVEKLVEVVHPLTLIFGSMCKARLVLTEISEKILQAFISHLATRRLRTVENIVQAVNQLVCLSPGDGISR